MDKNREKVRFSMAEMTTHALVQTYYCGLGLDVPPGTDESLRLAGRGR